jgi:hypothetical protein
MQIGDRQAAASASALHRMVIVENMGKSSSYAGITRVR